LERIYRVGSGDWDDLFLRGDYLGDRTQTLEIVYPPALNPGLFKLLLGWIAGNTPKWRIVVPTFLGHRDAFVVYQNEEARYAEIMPSEAFCREKANQMLALPVFANSWDRAREEGWPPPTSAKGFK
jgi:hypothetical protein